MHINCELRDEGNVCELLIQLHFVVCSQFNGILNLKYVKFQRFCGHFLAYLRQTAHESPHSEQIKTNLKPFNCLDELKYRIISISQRSNLNSKAYIDFDSLHLSNNQFQTDLKADYHQFPIYTLNVSYPLASLFNNLKAESIIFSQFFPRIDVHCQYPTTISFSLSLVIIMIVDKKFI